jgi:hypothetical protein
MKTVYSAPNLPLVSIVQNILEGHGIRCQLKNQFLSAGVGDIPPIECWPQLCVEDGDYPEAQRIVDDALEEKVLAPWTCGTCGEVMEGQFSDCWKCGADRPL